MTAYGSGIGHAMGTADLPAGPHTLPSLTAHRALEITLDFEALKWREEIVLGRTALTLEAYTRPDHPVRHRNVPGMTLAGMARTPSIDTDPGEPPRRVTDRLVDGTAGFASGALFGLLSATRKARFFHPTGRAFQATVDLVGIDAFTGSVLAKPGQYPAIVRFSRGAGLPESQPDGLGFALRLLNVDGLGGHQDFLLVSSVPAPIRRKFIHRYRSYSEAFYSSILPFRAGSRTVLFGVLPLWDGELMPTEGLEKLEQALASGRLRFELLAGGAAKAWETLGTVKIGRVLPVEEGESLRFSPFNRAGGIVPIGPANALRRRAYAHSQRRRPTPMDDPTTGAQPKYPTA